MVLFQPKQNASAVKLISCFSQSQLPSDVYCSARKQRTQTLIR